MSLGHLLSWHTYILNCPFVAPQNQYRSDLNWMKGVGWEAEGCLNIAQAKKAGELLSDVSTKLCCTYIFQFRIDLY